LIEHGPAGPIEDPSAGPQFQKKTKSQKNPKANVTWNDVMKCGNDTTHNAMKYNTTP
jgi:hypothetical protein